MDDLPKVGEKLWIMLEYGQKLLVTLSNVKYAFQTDGLRPIILSDSNLQAVYKAILKRFPDLGGLSQVQGASTFEANTKAFLETLGEAYETLLNVVDFRDGAIHVLNDCNRLVNLAFDLNPEILVLFLKLLICYVRVNLLVSLFADRKLVIATYSRAFFTANGTTEASYQRIAKYLTDFDNPIDKMQEDLFGLSARVGQVLVLLKQNFDRAFPLTDSLYNEGPLNPVHVAGNISKPSDEGKRLSDLSRSTELTEWILYGFLVCPSELSKPASVDLFKAALQKGLVYEIYRDDLINFHQEYEQLFSSYKGNVKQAKSSFSEASSSMVTISPGYHQERRNFLRWQLYQIYELLSDKPAITVPKLSMVLTALSVAKDEIFWYFRHLDKSSPKSSKYKFKEEDNKDTNITELLFLVTEIKSLVQKQKQAIQRYYLEFLGGFYKTKVQQLAEQVAQTQKFEDRMRLHIENLVETLSAVNPSNTDVSFEALRLNLVRLQVFFSLPTSSISPVAIGPFVALIGEIAARTRYIDQFETRVEEAGSLAALYYEKAAFLNTFALGMKVVAQSKFSFAYMNVAKSFLSNISPYYPKEAFIIGTKISSLLETIYSDLAKRIAELLHETAVTARDIALKGVPEQAARAIVRVRESKESKNRRNLLNEIDQNSPGSESQMRPSADMKKFNARRQLLKGLAVSLCKEESVTLYDTTFSPVQFLLEAISSRVRGFIAGILKVEPNPTDPTPPQAKRPALVYAEIESYLNATLALESAVQIGLPATLREVLLEQTDLESSRKLIKATQPETQNSKSKTKKVDRAPSSLAETTALFVYTKWYLDSILVPAQAGTLVYSPLRKGFVSRNSATLKSEKYATLSELIPLCQIIGPNGLKCFDERLMKSVSTTVGEIKEMVMLNSEALTAIRDNWQNEARCNDFSKKLKNIEGLLEKTISLGVVFAFRNLVAEALSHVLSSRVPHLFDCISNAHSQYPANTFGVAGYLTIDSLANWAGIFSNVDVGLRESLEVLCQDQAIDRRNWELLPYLYGVTLPALANVDGSYYNSNIEANENNSHCIALALNKIMVSVISLVTPSSEVDAIKNVQRNFVELASTSLLRLHKEKEKPRELESIVLVVAEFVNQSKFLTADILDSCLPYSYLRLAYSESFAKRIRKRGGKDDDGF